MNIRAISAATFSAAMALVACGSGSASPARAPVDQATNAPSAVSPGSSNVEVKSNQTSLGTVLVGSDGRTLYGFTNDVDRHSRCRLAATDRPS